MELEPKTDSGFSRRAAVSFPLDANNEEARTMVRRSLTEIGVCGERAGHVELAVVWVEKARKGSLQWVDSCDERQMQIYRWRKRVKPAVHFVMFCYLALALFEEPSWCLGDLVPCADVFDDMESSRLPVLKFQVTNTLEILCLLVFVARIWLRQKSLGAARGHEFWHKLLFVMLLLAGVDCVVAIFNTGGIFPGSFRLARVCRPVIFLCCYKNLRRTAERVIRSVPAFLSALASLAICILLFTWVGIIIFGGKTKDTEGSEHFKSFSESLASMWVLFTTNNSPDVWLLAYRDNRWSWIFFFVYLVIVLYLLSNVLLAAVYDAYKQQLKKELKVFYSSRKQAIEHAFRLLSDDGSSISIDTWTIFFFCFSNKRYGGVGFGGSEAYNLRRAHMAFEALDTDRSGGIDLEEFSLIVHVFHNVVSHMPRRPPPRRAHIPILGQLQNAIIAGISVRCCGEPRVVPWDNWIDVVIALDLTITFTQTVVFLDDKWAGGSFDNSIWMHRNSWYWLTFGFVVFYVIETAMKIWAFGFSRYWHKKPFQHRCDLANVCSLFALELVFLLLDPPDIVVRLSVLCRIARILRLLNHVKPLADLAAIMVQIIPPFRRLFMFLFIVFYIFATIGEQAFGGQIRHNNKALKPDSPFVQGNYWWLNFNDFLSGMVTLFTMMVANNWDSISGGFLLASGTAWSQVYFILFFVIVNLVVLNILMALVLETFSALRDDMDEKQQRTAASATDAPGRNDSQELRERLFEREFLLARVLQEECEES